METPRELPFNGRLRRDYTPTPQMTKAYLLGVLHDATVRKSTFRLGTKNKLFSQIIKMGIKVLGGNAWVYKEGKLRNFWIVEFSRSFLKGTNIESRQSKVEYIRGFFDAEGGIARSSKVRFYLYFCQKDKKVLLKIKRYLTDFGIKSGVIHNPSRRIDPNYWRFFISSKSYKDFATLIGSNHPEKLLILRKKI